MMFERRVMLTLLDGEIAAGDSTRKFDAVDATLRTGTKIEHSGSESPTNSISAFVLIHLAVVRGGCTHHIL